MTRNETIFTRVEALREEFRNTLKKELITVMKRAKSNFFCSAEFDSPSHSYLGSRKRSVDRILELGREIFALEDKLGLPHDEIVLSFREACRKYYDFEDEHRLGPKKIAKKLIEQIEKEAEQVRAANR